MTEFFRNRWWVVFASICGLLVGAGPVNVFAFAVFLKPVSESLGISRELFSSGLIVGSTVAGIGLIPLGFLLDHYRVRRVMMPGLVLYAVGVMGYALMTPSPLHIYLAFAIAALFGPIGSPLPYRGAVELVRTGSAVWRSASRWPGLASALRWCRRSPRY